MNEGRNESHTAENVSSNTSVYNFALMGIIYGGGYIGPVLRHNVYTCVLKLFMVTSHDVLLAM